jgi:hypothetical protein
MATEDRREMPKMSFLTAAFLGRVRDFGQVMLFYRLQQASTAQESRFSSKTCDRERDH